MSVRALEKVGRAQYEVVSHCATVEARWLADAAHVSDRQVTKTLLLCIDDGEAYLIAVFRCGAEINLAAVARAVGARRVELATEFELNVYCPGRRWGALPPFGSDYGMRTLIDRSLLGKEEFVCEGETLEESIRIGLQDFVRLEHPLTASITWEH